MGKAGQSSGPSSSAAKPRKPAKDWKSKGTYVSTILPIKLHIATSPNLPPVVLTFSSQEEAKGSINLDAFSQGIVEKSQSNPDGSETRWYISS